MKRLRLVILLVALLLCAPLLWSYHSFGRYTNDGKALVPVRYDPSALPNSTITFYLNEQRPSRWVSGDSIEALMSEISAAAATWDSVATVNKTSALRVAFGGYTKLGADKVPGNPIGIVRFSEEVPPGVAAMGGSFQNISAASSFIPIVLSYVSLPMDMSKTNTSEPSFLPVLIHEMAHSLGLHHSTVASVMLQTVVASRAKPLSEDDIASISTLYSTAAFKSSTGSIKGTVTNSSSGQPARIAAVTAFSDTVAVGANTNPDGSFLIQGLPPGNYRLEVQPLMLGAAPSPDANNKGDPDDLIQVMTMDGSKVAIDVNFNAAFFGSNGAATKDLGSSGTFAVAAGQMVTAPALSVAARGSSGLEVNVTFSYPSPQTSGVGQVWVAQGGRVSAQSYGRGFSASPLDMGFTNSGVSLASSSVRVSSSGDAIFTDTAFYSVQAGTGAAIGASSIIHSNATEIYLAPGHLHVVASPPPQITADLSPKAGPAGTQVTITGSNFDQGAQVYFDGMPAPVTQRTSNRLVVTAPRGAGGRGASVFVGNPDGQGSDFMGTPPTFSFDAAVQASIALSPASGQAGQTLTVTVTGSNTHFVQGVTALGFGSGDVVVNVNSIKVNSATSLTASISVSSSLDSNTFPVTAITGQEVAYLPAGFNIAAASQFLVAQSGNLQIAAASSTLPNPLVVRAQSEANIPISGVTVTFTVTFGGGSVSSATAVTDASGLASTRLTLGKAGGLNVVTATASGFSGTSFMAGTDGTNRFPSYRLPLSGQDQTSAAGTQLPAPLSVTFVDGAGNPVPGVQIVWQVTSGGGTIRSLSQFSDSTGKVSATWTLGPQVGPQTATATQVTDGSGFVLSPIVFNATAVTPITPKVPAGSVVNGAGFDSAVPAIAPGTIVSIFGSNLTSLTAGVEPGFASGTDVLLTIHKGTQVTFDGVAAPLFYVRSDQLNVQVPFEVAGKSSVQVVVSLLGKASDPLTVPVLPVSPALFTICSCGKGPAVLLNQDSTINTAANPAARGSVIQLYATGLGPTTPPGITGKAAPHGEPLARTTENYMPTATIGGLPAHVEFSGLAPWFVGLWQVNVTVPADTSTGEVSLVLTAGGKQANRVTLFLK